MSIETLESLLKNPDIWDIELSTQNMHDVLVEIASRVDSLTANQDKIKPVNNENEQQNIDIQDFLLRIDALSKQIERQNTDFGSEIHDLRALFNFQLRDIREKMDRNLNNIKESMSRPGTPPSVIQQIPDTDSNFELERKVHSLSKDIIYLKDKIRAMVTAINDLTITENPSNEDDENKSSEKKEIKIDLETTPSGRTLQLDEAPDVESISSRINHDESLTPNDTDFSSSRIKDSRYDGIIEDIEFMKKERKNDVERLNSTIKAVNQLIAEKDNNTNKINQCVRDSKRFNDEFDRLYQKMAEFQVEVDKKISEALNIRINNDFKSISSPDDQPLELPHLKEGIASDLSQIDNNYQQQINYLKLEISQLKQALSDKMLSNPKSNSHGSKSRSDVEVQTDDKLFDSVPTRLANTETQKTRVANEIMSQVIVSRTPIQFMGLNNDLVNMLKKYQQPLQQFSQPSNEKQKITKRQRKPVSTNSIEIQTNEENAPEQPDVNPPNEYADSENQSRTTSTSSSNKADDTRAKRLKSSNSSRKVTYIDSTTETQAELSGIGSPLRTPPRTPLRSQKQKRQGELIDILIETDPEITGEPLGITPELLTSEPSQKLPTNKGQENNSGSETQEKSKKEETSSTKREDQETEQKGDETGNKKKEKVSQKQEENKKVDTDSGTRDEPQADNVGTDTKSKTPQDLSRPGTQKGKQSEHATPPNEAETKTETETETKKEEATKTEQQKQKEEEEKQKSSSEASTKATTPVTQPGTRTETPQQNETEDKNQNEKEKDKEESDKKVSKKKHVSYADSGISMQINTYEKEIKEKSENGSDEDEVEVVDIEIQTDEISEEELSMYSIFNQENRDMMTGMGDMSYMERYSSSGANTNIGYQSTNQQKTTTPSFVPQQYYFSFEHLLSLTIISDYKAPEPQQIVVQVPEGAKTANGEGSNVDIQSIINKVLEVQNNKNFESLAKHVNENTQQIVNIFNILDDLKEGKPTTFKPAENGEKETVFGSNHPSRSGKESRKDSSRGNLPPASPGTPQGNSSISTNNRTFSPSPNNNNNTTTTTASDNSNLVHANLSFDSSKAVVVVADVRPDSSHAKPQTGDGNSSESEDEVNERLDQIDISISALEDHVYSLERKLINKGAFRPNSADPYDDETSPFGGSKARLSPVKYEENFQESLPRRHHHHHHVSSKSNKNSSHSHNHNSSNQEENNDETNPSNNENENENGNQNQNQNQSNNENENQGENQNKEGNEAPNASEPKPNHVVAIASGPDKPRTSKYYNQFTPGSLSQQRNQDAKKETIEFLPGFTIDPDVQTTTTTQEQVIIPEDLTIPKYERQFRLLREAVVELRTNIQILRVKTDQPVIIQPTENVEAEPDESTKEAAVDESTFRALRKKIEMTFEDYSSQIADIRRELYTHLEQPPDRIIEVRTEVQTVEKPKDDSDEQNNKNNGKKPALAPKDINVDLNLSKAMEMLSDTQHKNVISIHKIELPPEVKEHRDLYQRLQQNNPIIENNQNASNSVKPTGDLLQPPAPQGGNNGSNNNGENDNQTIDYTALPPPASTPLFTTVKNEGHVVPQIVQDMRVLNAMPKKDMLELLMPFLYQLRSELLLNIDSNTERIRCIEASMQSKVDKEFIESFFRKIRIAVKEADDKAMRACNFLLDKVSKQDLEDRVQELLKQIGTQETTVAGKTSYTCLFCGAKRNAVSKSSMAADKGKIFKGRANRQSLQAGELSQLPPLSDPE